MWLRLASRERQAAPVKLETALPSSGTAGPLGVPHLPRPESRWLQLIELCTARSARAR